MPPTTTVTIETPAGDRRQYAAVPGLLAIAATLTPEELHDLILYRLPRLQRRLTARRPASPDAPR